MSIDKNTEETARQLFYQISGGPEIDEKVKTIRTTKAICHLLAILESRDLISAKDIDAIISEAIR